MRLTRPLSSLTPFFWHSMLLVTTCLCSLVHASDLIGTDASTLRTTREGDVVGMRVTRSVDAWQGIPYARPPVGTLRWRAPQPPAPWQGIRYGISMAPPCSQSVFDPATTGHTQVRTIGQEDCLYLGIWSPHFERTDLANRKSSVPVMVWIHGGGSEVGSGAVFNPSVLVTTQQVIVVTVNYRLNLLGPQSRRTD